jgi:hypothetical protein
VNFPTFASPSNTRPVAVTFRVWTTRRWVLGRSAAAAALLCVSATTSTGLAQPTGEPSASEETTTKASTDDTRLKPPLQALPELPEQKLRPGTPEELAIVDDVLSRLTDASDTTRQSALTSTQNVSENLVPALRSRVDKEAASANRTAMKELLIEIRREARAELEKQHKASGARGTVETPDYLEMVLQRPRSSDKNWRDLVNILALSRMSVAVGTVDAVRTLIHIYVRFEFLRIDTQLQLTKLGERAIPALIEATRHQAPQVSEWAQQQLDFGGKAIPSEAVRVNSPEALADILRAYGYTKDPDALRLVLSFASSERAQIRLAARQAIRGYGSTAVWVLRDAYEQTLGEKPSREWTWDRLAKELFREFDRNRLAEVYALFQTGMGHMDASDLSAAVDSFEKLLNRNPDFEPKETLADAFLRFAQSEKNGAKEWDRVELALQHVLHLGNEQQRQQAQSALLVVKARRLAARGLADQFLLRQAIELNDKNNEARELLAELETEPFYQRRGVHRWLWPSVLGTMSLLFVGILMRKRGHPSP